MSYLRTKTVTLDAAEFVITSLTGAQVDKYFGKDANDGGDPVTFARLQVCDSLNAAGRNKLPNDEQWTPEVLQRETDPATQLWLQRQIYDFSGLVPVEPGESSAAAPTSV